MTPVIGSAYLVKTLLVSQPTTFVRPPCIMASMPDFSSLADRLKKVNTQTASEPTVDPQSIMQMTKAELQQKKITFGKTYLGKSFQEMLNNPGYLTWFSGRYHASQKPDHMMFLRFIQLHVEEQEQKQPENTVDKTSTKAKGVQPKAKVAPKGLLPTSAEVEIEDSDEDWEPEAAVGVTQMELMGMQNRMSEMEAVMQQILHHLSAAQSPNP